MSHRKAKQKQRSQDGRRCMHLNKRSPGQHARQPCWCTSIALQIPVGGKIKHCQGTAWVKRTTHYTSPSAIFTQEDTLMLLPDWSSSCNLIWWTESANEQHDNCIRYLLCYSDVSSKYALVRALRSKCNIETAGAMEEVLSARRTTSGSAKW